MQKSCKLSIVNAAKKVILLRSFAHLFEKSRFLDTVAQFEDVDHGQIPVSFGLSELISLATRLSTTPELA